MHTKILGTRDRAKDHYHQNHSNSNANGGFYEAV